MCFWLLFTLFALAGRAASAQVPPAALRPDSLATATSARPASDTLAAIHKLFTTRRQQTFGALRIVAATGAAITFISATAHSSGSGGGGAYGINFPGSGNDDSNIASLGVGMLAIPTLAGELLFFDR